MHGERVSCLKHSLIFIHDHNKINRPGINTRPFGLYIFTHHSLQVTAYLSNHAKVPFVYDGTPYTSSEQGFHHLGAAHHLEFEVAERILKTDDIAKIRELSHEYPRSPGWERLAPHKLYELNREKFTQNPHLRARLIATAPHRLIEASIDQKWGGAAPYSSGVYDEGIVPGRNVFGDKLTSLRDDYDVRLSANDMLATKPSLGAS